MIKAGDILQGRYRIERQIGAGGMGAVFVATDERFGSTVAIKETLFTDERLRKAFEREARLLNSLRHHALPRVSDHFVDENGQFIVMEYIAGEDLSEMMLKRRKAFPVADVLDWADQLLEALDFLHTQEMPVIHRDIKPQNLKLTPRGQIILLDFGLAKGNPTEADSPTAAKSVFGYSRSYASLEQIQGTGTDPRSDLYSLAATLYHLMTGVPPAEALTRAMRVLNGENDPLVPAHQIQSEIPFGVSEVLTRSMALNASHRPSSAAAMRELLREGALVTEVPEGFQAAVHAPFSAGTSLFTQNTAVMSDEARLVNTTEAEDETSVRTKVVGDANRHIQIPFVGAAAGKQATVIQPLAEATEYGGAKRSRFKAAAVVISILLAVCGASAALYVYNPQIFQDNTPNATIDDKLNLAPDEKKEQTETKTITETAANVAVTDEDGDNDLDVEPADEPAETVASKKNSVSSKGETKSHPETATTVSGAKNPKEASGENLQTGETWVFRDPDEPNGETVKFKGERIETKDVIIEKDGKIVLKNMPKFPPGAFNTKPFLTPQQMEKLSPEQREKIQKAFEMHRVFPKTDNVKPPIPPNTVYVPQPKPQQTP